MSKRRVPGPGWPLLAASALAMAVACASSKAGSGDPDGGPVDAAVYDAENPCANVTCDGLAYCDDTGTCQPYPECTPPPDAGVGDDAGVNPEPGTGTCPDGQVCRNGVCLPDDQDFDHDGYPASSDCDETNGMIHPGAPEICNGLDDDCQFGVDNGDPVALCENDPTGSVCENGSCGCLPGTFDLDPTIPNCECVAAPLLEQGTTCADAIDVGDLFDSGQMATVTGNLVPMGRRTWYRFRGGDLPDTTCDNLHVRAWLADNPGDQFRIGVARGACDENLVADLTDYEWATDFRASINGTLSGECPCTAAGGTPQQNVSTCADDSAYYYVVVERTSGVLTCDSYQIELSNGVYDTP
ncbi:MAG: putative metal-binding motif-containing protein [Myxococcales bacterium]|nr:putative metal-binding motif-containing protein [Myxococcales bacterium]